MRQGHSLHCRAVIKQIFLSLILLLTVNAAFAGDKTTIAVDVYIAVTPVEDEPDYLAIYYSPRDAIVVEKSAMGSKGIIKLTEEVFVEAKAFTTKLHSVFAKASKTYADCGVEFTVRDVYLIDAANQANIQGHYKADDNEISLGVSGGESQLLKDFDTATKGTTGAFRVLMGDLSDDGGERGRGQQPGSVSAVHMASAMDSGSNGHVLVHEFGHNFGLGHEDGADPFAMAMSSKEPNRRGADTNRNAENKLSAEDCSKVKTQISQGRYNDYTVGDAADKPRHVGKSGPSGTVGKKDTSPVGKKAPSSAGKKAPSSAGKKAPSSVGKKAPSSVGKKDTRKGKGKHKGKAKDESTSKSKAKSKGKHHSKTKAETNANPKAKPVQHSHAPTTHDDYSANFPDGRHSRKFASVPQDELEEKDNFIAISYSTGTGELSRDRSYLPFRYESDGTIRRLFHVNRDDRSAKGESVTLRLNLARAGMPNPFMVRSAMGIFALLIQHDHLRSNTHQAADLISSNGYDLGILSPFADVDGFLFSDASSGAASIQDLWVSDRYSETIDSINFEVMHKNHRGSHVVTRIGVLYGENDEKQDIMLTTFNGAQTINFYNNVDTRRYGAVFGVHSVTPITGIISFHLDGEVRFIDNKADAKSALEMTGTSTQSDFVKFSERHGDIGGRIGAGFSLTLSDNVGFNVSGRIERWEIPRLEYPVHNTSGDPEPLNIDWVNRDSWILSAGINLGV